MKKNYIYAMITVIVWATTAAVSKKLLSEIPNLEMLAISGFMAALYLVAVNLKTGKFREMKRYTAREYGVMAGLGFLGLFVYSALYNYGLTVLSSQEACILNYLWPMMLIIFSCLILKEPMTFLKGVAMVCSFVGTVILSAGGGTAATGSVPGMVACIVAAACYGLFSVLNKKADFDQNISMMVFWLVTGICSVVMGLATENWVPLSGMQWIGMLWMGIVGNGVAYLLWALALNDAENTAKIANLAYLVPFLSVIVSAVFLKETLRIQALAALVFIVGGVLLQSLAGERR